VFVVSQFTYTLAALLPAKFLFESRLVHMWFLVIIFGICVWNGAGFYIEVGAALPLSAVFGCAGCVC